MIDETMKQAVKAAEKCGQQYGKLTYDLVIASKVYKFQSMYQDSAVKNLFIHVGLFHVWMSYSKAVGKFIEDCDNILVDVKDFILSWHFQFKCYIFNISWNLNMSSKKK